MSSKESSLQDKRGSWTCYRAEDGSLLNLNILFIIIRLLILFLSNSLSLLLWLVVHHLCLQPETPIYLTPPSGPLWYCSQKSLWSLKYNFTIHHNDERDTNRGTPNYKQDQLLLFVSWILNHTAKKRVNFRKGGGNNINLYCWYLLSNTKSTVEMNKWNGNAEW